MAGIPSQRAQSWQERLTTCPVVGTEASTATGAHPSSSRATVGVGGRGAGRKAAAARLARLLRSLFKNR